MEYIHFDKQMLRPKGFYEILMTYRYGNPRKIKTFQCWVDSDITKRGSEDSPHYSFWVTLENTHSAAETMCDMGQYLWTDRNHWYELSWRELTYSEAKSFSDKLFRFGRARRADVKPRQPLP